MKGPKKKEEKTRRFVGGYVKTNRACMKRKKVKPAWVKGGRRIKRKKKKNMARSIRAPGHCGSTREETPIFRKCSWKKADHVVSLSLGERKECLVGRWGKREGKNITQK